MRRKATLSLAESTLKKLDRMARDTGVTKSGLVDRAIDMLYDSQPRFVTTVSNPMALTKEAK